MDQSIICILETSQAKVAIDSLQFENTLWLFLLPVCHDGQFFGFWFQVWLYSRGMCFDTFNAWRAQCLTADSDPQKRKCDSDNLTTRSVSLQNAADWIVGLPLHKVGLNSREQVQQNGPKEGQCDSWKSVQNLAKGRRNIRRSSLTHQRRCSRWPMKSLFITVVTSVGEYVRSTWKTQSDFRGRHRGRHCGHHWGRRSYEVSKFNSK